MVRRGIPEAVSQSPAPELDHRQLPELERHRGLAAQERQREASWPGRRFARRDYAADQ
jgi:hypothetical protein